MEDRTDSWAKFQASSSLPWPISVKAMSPNAWTLGIVVCVVSADSNLLASPKKASPKLTWEMSCAGQSKSLQALPRITLISAPEQYRWFPSQKSWRNCGCETWRNEEGDEKNFATSCWTSWRSGVTVVQGTRTGP